MLKPDERNTVIAVAAIFMLLYGGGWWLWGPVATVPALGLAVALLAALILGATRRLRGEFDNTLKQTQSLLFLQKNLQNDQPLPALGGAALFPDSAATLVGLIRANRPRLVVELGSGISTLIVSYCLRDQGGGKMISLDHDEYYGGITRQNLKRHGLDHIAEVRSAPIRPVEIDGKQHQWYDTQALENLDGQIDMLIVDGPPRKVQSLARYPALPLLIDRLSDHAVVLVDDANRADEREIVRLWQERFPGFTVTHIPIGEGTTLFERGG